MNTQRTNISAAWIAEVLGTNWSSPARDNFTSICIDSRETEPGSLFVGVKTPTGHRQEYTATAAKAGARAAIVENFQSGVDIPQLVVKDPLEALRKLALAKRHEYKGTVMALTGSSGKTCAKELLSHLLGPKTYKTRGNLNNHLGVPITLIEGDLTAPFWVIEAGTSSKGEIRPLAEVIQPDAALITMIGSAHMEFFKTQEAIAEEKGYLLQSVSSNGLCVLHARDLAYGVLRKIKSRVLVLGRTEAQLPENYSQIPFQANDLPEGWEVVLGAKTFHLPMWTPGIVRNAALSIAVATQQGVPSHRIQEKLLSWHGVALRGEWLRIKGSPPNSRAYLDAYNSNPEALSDSLWRFHHMSSPKVPKLYVIGTMNELGDNSDTMHKQAVSQLGESSQDLLCFIGKKANLMKESTQNSKAKEVFICDKWEEVLERVARFEGDVFIKGSHSTNLYRIAESCEALTMPNS